MTELIRRSDVPNANAASLRQPNVPKARINRYGTLYLSITATQAMGKSDCYVIAEYDHGPNTLKFTVASKPLPEGLEERDLFLLRIRTSQSAKSPIGMISIRSLLRFIGFDRGKKPKPQDFPIASLDAKMRSITLVIPS